MNAFAEPLILYAVLFFRFLSGPVMPDAPFEFSAGAEAARVILHTGPALALVWYLLLRAKSLREWGVARPGKSDAIPAAISLAAISLVGIAVTLAAAHFGGLPEAPRMLPPTEAVPWAVLAVSVFAGAYLEESFFRFYLLSKLPEAGLGTHRAVLVSTVLFAICHAYAGPWGIANAAISGAVLSYVFLRFRSLHGVSVAHGIYNVVVIALGAA